MTHNTHNTIPTVNYIYEKIKGENIYIILSDYNNYATKIVSAYIVYALDTWRKISINNFKLKHCFFVATNIVKKLIKVSGCILDMEWHLMLEVRRVLVLTLLRML